MYFKILVFTFKLLFIFTVLFWLVDNPGSILINWQGYEIKTTVSFAVFVLLVLLFLFALVRSGWDAIVWVARKIFKFGNFFKKDTDKLIAQAFSDLEFQSYKSAKKISLELSHLLPTSPIPGILLLKTSQALKDKKLEEMALNHLKKFDEFVPMALYDEMDNAFKANQTAQLEKLLLSACKKFSNEGWFLKNAIRLDMLKSNWEQALENISRAAKKDVHSKETLDHLKAICFYSLAHGEENSPREIIGYHEQAYKEESKFLPNLLEYAKILKNKKDKRAAEVLLKKAWEENPSWEIAETYCELTAEDEKPISLAHASQELYEILPDHPVSIITQIIYLIQAGLWAEAHRLLNQLPIQAPESILLQAALAKKEKGSAKESLGLVMHAIENMSSPYKCSNCLKASNHWHMYCPSCQGFDSLHLKHPITYKNCLEALE
ncbi:MAG: hypothetical protein WCG05_04090 [Alphaproteobacteria bacterium]